MSFNAFDHEGDEQAYQAVLRRARSASPDYRRRQGDLSAPSQARPMRKAIERGYTQLVEAGYTLDAAQEAIDELVNFRESLTASDVLDAFNNR